MTEPARMAVDIGGTFTDVVVETSAERFSAKVLSTIQAPEEGVMQGIEAVLKASGLKAAEIGIFIHGTTLATNALIERKGAKTAFVTTEGFRDILEMGFEKRFEQYDVFMDRPPPLVPRPLRHTVPERMDAQGTPLTPLDEDAVAALAPRFKSEGVEAVAIGFLHGYANRAHEERARDILQSALPGVTICVSSEVCPEIREYERFSTTCANAYVRPLVSGYLNRLDKLLRQSGMDCPLFLMMSGGGLTQLDQATRFPIRLVESGPAGGAILAAQIAREQQLDEVLAFDMGGTTAKICLIQDAEPARSRKFEVAREYRDLKGSGLPLRIPVIELVEIGAGGGSIARVDAMKRITVGPDSAGSEPGPACYGRGGVSPTVTDANVVLGRIDPERFAGGNIRLDDAASRRALIQDVGANLNLEDYWPAAGVAEIVEENMANAARVHAIERGKVISRHIMVAFGGGAPLHAGRLAEKLGIDRVLVPSGAGVGSAIGFLRAPVSFEVVRSHTVQCQDMDITASNALIDEMSAEAYAVVEPGLLGRDAVEQRIVDVRYAGQGHELVVTLPRRQLDAADRDDIRRNFENLYRTIYGLTLDELPVEIIAWSVTVASAPEAVEKIAGTEMQTADSPGLSRLLYDPGSGEMIDAPVFWREDLPPGTFFSGPAVIAEDETSTIVPKAFDAFVDGAGTLVLERRPESSTP